MKISRINQWAIGMAVLMAITMSSLATAQEIKVGAGAAGTEDIFNKIKEPFEKSTGMKLILISNGPVEAFKELDKGLLDVAVGGVTFPDWIEMMEKEGYNVPDKSIYPYRVIGKDTVKVIVNKENRVKKLSRDQLKDIFSGKTVNWKDVGGKDMPVVVVWGSKIPGTNAVFRKQIMEGATFTGNVRASTTAAEIKKIVASISGGVGLGPAAIADATVSAPEIPEIGRPITAITKGAPSPRVMKLYDFIRGAGQKHLAK
ncbi:MAG TPA: substrate-binding domain-containing protein [Syntrophales bacterium]|nr:substrate-binding domain-containing protein [Syntrophales bacterium]HQK78632.1 substrate-binding domain-containing protein [Syntrophales bacterium]